MSAGVIVGLQWGDEAKGRVVDYLAKDADLVVRYAGGDNSGHTLYVNGDKTVLGLVPAGVLNENVKCVLAEGMVINILTLADEIKTLQNKNVNLLNRLFISEKAHIVFPEHVAEDGKDTKIGTTKKGIGPAYADKANRAGLQISYLCENEPWDEKWRAALDVIKPFLCDTSFLINKALKENKNVLFEGNQGTLLDNTFGTYPFVTSSSTISGSACTGAGVGPTAINYTLGLTKAYTTRIGSGPFPTELDGEAADALREAGQEYGSVTGRPRRVGWLDLPLLRYARDINNIHSLVVTKLDVLSGLDEIKVCTFYGNQKRNEYPINVIDDAGPKYVTLPGWNDDISNVKSLEELPVNARNYIEFIEENLDIPISLISVGADRNCIIDRRDYVSDFYSKKVMENIKPAVNEQLTDLYTILNRAASKLDELEQTKAEEN